MPDPSLKIYECITGSQLYGTAMPDSDVDYITVFAETKDMTLGLDGTSKLAQSSKDENDIRQYWLRRWAMLCTKGNPNVLESVFAPNTQRSIVNTQFKKLFLDNPEIFLFKKPLVDAHLGFAFAQIKRMDGANLGAQRKELVAKYGYDVKFAAHALRLVSQLDLILTTGKIVFPYPDEIRNTIKSIRDGNLTREQFDKVYNELAADVQNNADKCTSLPDEIDTTALNERVIAFFEHRFYSN